MYEARVVVLARKILVNRTVCTECGKDLVPSSQCCHGCGTSISSLASPEHEVPSVEYVEDVPDRASYVFWLDGLLFTSAWYIPAILVILIVISLFLAFYPGNSYSLAVALLAVAAVALAVWFYLKDRRGNRTKL